MAAIDAMTSTLKRMLRMLGIELKRINRAPPPPVFIDPLDAVSRIRSGEAAAILAPLPHCVTFNGLNYGESGWHPFVETAKELLANPKLRYEESVLHTYYARWQPANGLQCLICPLSGPAVLESYPAHTMHSPWIEANPDERTRFTERNVEIESLSHGKIKMTVEDGYGLQGPVSKRKGLLEFERLKWIMNAIRARGYDRSGGDVTAHLLMRGSQVRFRIMHGHHRAAALSALGCDNIAISPVLLADVQYVEHWPQVYRGVWSRSEAISYFNHHFDFDSKEWASKLGCTDASRLDTFDMP